MECQNSSNEYWQLCLIRFLNLNQTMSSESDVELTPPEITEAAKQACVNLIPEISKEKYVKAYKSFTDWQREKGTASYLIKFKVQNSVVKSFRYYMLSP